MLLALTVAADPLLLSGRCPVLEDLLLGAFLPMVNKYVSVYSTRVRVACYGIRRRACAPFNRPSKHNYILVHAYGAVATATMPPKIQ